MRKGIIWLFLVFVPIMIFGAKLQNLTFFATQETFQARLLFDSKPNWALNGVLGNHPQITFDGTISTNISKEMTWGPVKVTMFSTDSHSAVKFSFPFIVSTFVGEEDHTLVVSFVTLGISQSLALTGPATRVSIDFSGQKGSTLGLAIKYLARILKRNLVIEPEIAQKPVNITLSDVTPAEAFYDVLISSPGVGYAILPDGTYYIAPVDALVKDLGKLGVGTYNNIVSFYDLSTTNIASSTFSSLVSNLFGKNKVIDFIGSHAIVKATVEQQKTIKSLMDFIKESENFKTVEWKDAESESDLQNLITTMYPTVKIMYLKSFSTIVMKGATADLEKAFNVISKYKEILSQSGPKITMTFSVPVQNVPAFLQFTHKFPSITAYGSPSYNSSSAVYIVNGPKVQISEFEKNVELIASTLTIAKPRIIHVSFANWTDKKSVNDLFKIIGIMYPDVKYSYLTSFEQILFYGTNAKDVDMAADFAQKRTPKETLNAQRITITVEISPNDLKAVNSLLEKEYPTLFGTGTIASPTAKSLKYVISGPSTSVKNFISDIESAGLVKKSALKVSQNTLNRTNVYIREVPWNNEIVASDVENLMKLKYPDINFMYLKNLKEFVVYGKNSGEIDDAAKFITTRSSKFEYAKTPPVTTVVRISPDDYETVKSMVMAKGLEFYGPSTPATRATSILVAISGSKLEVGNAVAMMETTGLARLPIVNATPTEVSTRVQRVIVNNGKVSCDVEEYPLSSLIERVYKAFDRNVIFAYQSLPNVTLKLSNVPLGQFEYAISNAYGLSFSGTSLVVVESNTSGITRVYRASGNVNSITSMAKFVGGKVFTDTNTGVIVVSGLTPSKAEKLDYMVKPLISPRKDVEIEAKIVDVNKNNDLTQNIDTTFMTPQLIFNNGLNLNFKLIDVANLPHFLSGLADNIISSNATMDAKISQTTGSGSILSAPTLTTQSGESANILVGSKYPYIVTTSVNGQQKQELKFLNTGIQLTILPLVLPNGQISLTITIDVSDADWGHAVNGIPAVNTRSASMKVVISDGQTLMIGGLIKHDRSQNVTKMPFLGDLPFIGQFFRSTTFQDSTDNLDIFITAKIAKE